MTEEPASYNVENKKVELKKCPFCGSDDLAKTSWYLDKGEVDAIECSDCYGSAPLPAWNTRVTDSK